MTVGISDVPVHKSVIVNVPIDEAFQVFTEDIDSWWPRTHHIGKSPMRRVIVEGRMGGRCYTEQVDGTECDWGQVMAWEPPARLVLAWQITHEWGFQPDLAKASEVEVRFVPIQRGATRVEIEHRFFSRHGAGGETMRSSVDAPNGWSIILSSFADRVKARTTSASRGTP